jgi:6-phosphogluconolactonase
MPNFAYLGCGNATGDILVFAVDPATGGLIHTSTTPSGSSTSYAAFHPSGRWLYTTQNRADLVSAFTIDPATGALTPLNQIPVPAADPAAASGPAHLEVDATGRFLLVANYRGHNVVVFPLAPDGQIGAPLQSLPDGRNAHSVWLDPTNRFAFVPYLGSDRVGQYRFDAQTGRLTPNDPPAVETAPGAGPRHLAFHPSGQWAYLINELDSTVYAYAYDQTRGTLTERQRLSTLPAGYEGRRWSSELHVTPSGAHLFASNRAHESLARFAIDQGTGLLTLLGHEDVRGQTPRNFALDADGRFAYVANQDSANLVTFAIDDARGTLAHVASTPTPPTPYYVSLFSGRARFVG